MREIWISGWLLMAVFLSGGCRKNTEAEIPRAVPLREDGGIEMTAATYNIRNENDRDVGERAWPRRIGGAIRLIRGCGIDVLGMQEVTHHQAADLRASLPDYDFYGIARDDGDRRGEYAPIFFRKDRFSADPGDAGTFWLSDIPAKAGSATWGNSLARVAAWVRLVDRATGRGVYVFNTHFDHQHQGSRERAALLIAERIDGRRHPEDPVILLGDFNAVEGNPAVVYFSGRSAMVAGARRAWANGMTDAYRVANPGNGAPKSLHLWGRKDAGWKVDHIFVSKGGRVKDATVVVEPPPYSSDHFPVTARLIFP